MNIDRKSVDVFWKSDGDFALDSRGDIRKADARDARVGRQILMNRLMSAHGDWPLQQNLGAGIADFAGMPNTRETAQRLKARIVGELTWDGAVNASTLKVQIVPNGLRSLLIMIYAVMQYQSEDVVLSFTYDIRDNKLVPRVL